MVNIVVSVGATFGLISINDGPITELLDTGGLPPTAIDVNKNKQTRKSDFLH